MRVVKTTRLASNPHRTKKRNRKMSPKQIAHFGTKRQRAALKSSRKRKRTMKNTRVKRARVHRVKRSTNPLVLHLKPMQQRSNPKRRAATMAKPKRRRRTMHNARRRVARVSNRRRRHASNPVRHRRRTTNRRAPNRRRRSNSRRRNATRVVVMAPRRANRRHSHRNPQLFGSSLGSKQSLMILAGGLTGVAATKFIPTLIPTSLTAGLGSSSFGPFIISGVSAIAAWWLSSKVSVPFSEGVLFGGLMQTASVALNAFLPGFTIAGVPIALSGFGDLVAGSFPVPMNPLRQRQLNAGAGNHTMAPAGSKVTTSGLGRAYPSAY